MMKGLKGASPPAIDELLRYAAWTRRLALCLVSDESLADDVAQDVWLAATRRPPDASEPLEPWLRTVVRHTIFNRSREQRRRQQREKDSPSFAEAQSPEELLERLETHRMVVEAVGELAEPYRRMILLRYFEGLSSAEIGARENIPPPTVRGRLKTAVETLREVLDRRCGGRGVWLPSLAALCRPPAPTVGRRPGPASSPGTTVRPLEHGRRLGFAGAAVVVVATGAAWVARPPAHREPPATAQVTRASVQAAADPQPAVGADLKITLTDEARPHDGAPARSADANRRQVLGNAQAPVAGLPDNSPRGQISGVVQVGANVRARVRSPVRLGTTGGLGGVMIRIVNGAAPSPPAAPRGDLLLSFRQRRYEPRVQFGQVGQAIVIDNGDDTARAVRAFQGSIKLFDQVIPGGTRTPAIAIPDSPELIRFDQGGPPSETAIVVPTSNPFHAVTAGNGRFVLSRLAAGTYAVEAWDEDLGTLTQEATVTPSGAQAPLVFTFGESSLIPPGGWPVRDCTIATSGHGPIFEACLRGGRPEAKKVMKTLVNESKGRGPRITCERCHLDLDGYALTDGAREGLTKLLALVGR